MSFMAVIYYKDPPTSQSRQRIKKNGPVICHLTYGATPLSQKNASAADGSGMVNSVTPTVKVNPVSPLGAA
jgi:hypothetical protein